jgi:hypothetical protein
MLDNKIAIHQEELTRPIISPPELQTLGGRPTKRLDGERVPAASPDCNHRFCGLPGNRFGPKIASLALGGRPRFRFVFRGGLEGMMGGGTVDEAV